MKSGWVEALRPEDWKRVDSLLDAVFEMDPEAIPAYLDRACADEPELRRRIDRVLRADRLGTGLLEAPALGWQHDSHCPTAEVELETAPPPGFAEPPERVGRFRVLQELGRGGMGVVFLAREDATERTVALKTMPEGFPADASRVALFLGEARLLASLHHPNIAKIHGLERLESGQRFLVLEFVEGKTLADRIAAGPLPLSLALSVGHQVASALAAAHAQRIVHRDLKPSNLMLSPSGLVKVLDFGIARHVLGAHTVARHAGRSRSGVEAAPMGTPGYMSPEQILGSEPSAACDAFAFGCVLYECLTGRAAFARADRFASLSATLHSTADLGALPNATPQPVRALLERCLEKEAARRTLDLSEAAATLAGFRPVRGIRAKRGNRPDDRLPTPVAPFIGRERELEECVDALAKSRLVTLTGAGGCGKTRLAIETARNVPEDRYEVSWFVDLAPAKNDSGIQAALAAALDLRDTAGSEALDALYRRLAGRTGLLVLDNCEHVVAACAAMVRTLIPRCPTLHVLATSREWLGVPGELTLRVSPLPVPDPAVHRSAATIAASESVRLFVQHAAAVRPAFTLDESNAASVASICRTLDGIPLAIELAAALLSQSDLESIAADLSSFQPRAAAADVDTHRHTTLDAAIGLSYRRLDEPDRGYFEALSVFSGGWSLESATAVCGGEDAFEALDRLTRLMDQSLVLVDPADHLEARYRFLEPIRTFARSRVAGKREGAALRVRHVQHFTDLAESLEPFLLSGSEQLDALRRFEADHPNLLAALGTCESGEADGTHALRIVKATWRFWYMRGHLAVGRQAILTALQRSAAEEVSTSVRAYALAGGGVLTMYLRDDLAARRLYREALSLHRAEADGFGEASTLNHLGAAAVQRGQHERARVFFQAARARFEQLQQPRWLALTLNNLGAVARQKGDLVAASEYFDRAIPLAREVRNLDDLALTLVNSALVNLRLGRVETARDRIHEAIEVVRDVGAKRVATAALEVASEVLLALGLPEDSARLLGSAERVRFAIGVPADDGWRRAQQPFLDRLRRCLDPSRYEELVHEGALVSFEEVLDHVCRLVETPA